MVTPDDLSTRQTPSALSVCLLRLLLCSKIEGNNLNYKGATLDLPDNFPRIATGQIYFSSTPYDPHQNDKTWLIV
jgi:hypothetical protein